MADQLRAASIVIFVFSNLQIGQLAFASLAHSINFSLLITGNFAAPAIRALKAAGLNPSHYDIRFIKPLDEAFLHEALHQYEKIITVEDATIEGGFGSAVLEFMVQHGYKNDTRILGLPDKIVVHGTPKELHKECGNYTQAIMDAVRKMMKEKIQVKTIG